MLAGVPVEIQILKISLEPTGTMNFNSVGSRGGNFVFL